MKTWNVAAVQIGAGGNKSDNLSKALEAIDRTVIENKAVDLVVLPEYCNGEPTQNNVAELAESIPGEFSEAMREKARSHQINLVTGSFAETATDGRAYNTTLVFDRNGEEIGRYRKTHLMDALRFRETAFIAPGNELCVCELDVGRLGVMVCYDLRFPEIARTLALKGAEIIAIPAAFPCGQPLPPRTDHWDVLVTSTALYNLCYVVAANQYGNLGNDHLFGRSMVVDPWGIAIARAQGREDVIHARVDPQYVHDLRQQLPTLQLRRPELYELANTDSD